MNDSVPAIRDAARAMLQAQHDNWREIVTGLGPDALNWKPGRDTNSIAALLAHTLDAERFLVATAADSQTPREGESTFRASASGADELLLRLGEVEKDVERRLAGLSGDHLSQEITRTMRTTRTRTGIAWLLHALAHSREHIGQAYLTRQLWEQHANQPNR